jgi:hypothetical protein
MGRKSFVPHTLLSLCFLVSIDISQVIAANMRSFIEAVRRKATVVYVGSVKESAPADTNEVRHQSTGSCGRLSGCARLWHEPS